MKVSKGHNLLCSFFEITKFHLLLRVQYILLTSLYFRFYSFNENSIQNFTFLEGEFSSNFKFQLVFNLRRVFEISISGSFFSKKIFGRIFLENFYSIYEICLLSLWRSVLFPIFELCSDRFLLDFRPFRISQDTFSFLKRNILSKRKYFCFNKSLYLISPFVGKVLLKSCFVPKTVLKSWLNFCRVEQKKFCVFDFSFFRDSGNVYFNFFNFLINGLVCF